MQITERQESILNNLIQEYINSAKPVSSQLLEDKHSFDLSSATIRNEMQRLTEEGFLYQPHTSSGRVPTDKGYRFFVDRLVEEENFRTKHNIELDSFLGEEITQMIRSVRLLTKHLAEASSALVFSYMEQEDIIWKEGWEDVLREPEFEEKEHIINFTEFSKDLEEHIGDLEIVSGVNIYIGKENPFSKADDFSIISTACSFSNEEKAIFAILGPKRMAYDKNIGLINFLTKMIDDV